MPARCRIWNALLKRSFLTLKADGPFIFERARVNAMATDRLASLGDPPAGSALELVRFRLEGIDTGWKVVTARRVLPGDVEPKAKPAKPAEPPVSKSETVSPGEMTSARQVMRQIHRDARAASGYNLLDRE